jgi:CRP/FNR family cyclic AMP-dependent transcriptional regulator
VTQRRTTVIAIPEFFEAAKGHELLKRFESRHLEKLLGLAREAEFARDHIFFRQGEKACFFYLIVRGSVALESAARGHRVTVQTLLSGDAMGWSAVTDANEGAHFDARALEPVHAIAFDGAQLRAACEADPAFGFVMMRALLSLVSERLDASRLQMSKG